ncbi:4-amino-4-deoxychorismate lyase [Nitratiruptor tergarcus DSM 16512]|uniref:4-amino-4-deoxychorismate lyase n=2 Tax=Nitratiruptor tergarcus TaxID=269259 RepID=A0A1W1WPW0_9BACT|nr:aminotransferase class IV family protein [Nitratiruptor tergarcus]SMC08276.1 4-amino-4-deoxychorismate lyase [Nitratiruptor tergarcus DSM 16512]
MKMQFFETIKIINGQAQHLAFHNRRFWQTQKKIFGIEEKRDLANFIKPPQIGLYRCKIIYDTKIRGIAYYPYTPRIPHTFKLIHSPIDYSFKYLDRSEIERLFTLRQEADDVIIVKDGLLTDTSIANIAFFYKNEWLTPKTPLLPGTTRARLLEKKRLKAADIEVKDIKKFATMAIMNAMIDFTIIENFSIKE